MNLEKMRAAIMARDNCSAEEADAKMAAMTDDEKAALWGEIEKTTAAAAPAGDPTPGATGPGNMSGDDPANDKDLADGKDKPHAEPDGDEKERKLAAKKKLQTLLAKGKKITGEAKLAARRADISTRLSKLRADAKLTPAEIKRFGDFKLEEASDASIDLLFRVLEARETVVPIGMVGSVKAVDLSAAGREAKKEEIRADAMTNMKFTAKMIEKTKKLAKKQGRLSDVEGDDPTPGKVGPGEMSRMSDDQLSHYLDMIEDCMTSGDLDHAIGHMKSLRKHLTGGGGDAPPVPTNAAMAALTKKVSELTAYIAELEQAVGVEAA